MKIVADIGIPFLENAFILEKVSLVQLSSNKITDEVLKDATAFLTRTRTTCDDKLLKNSTIKFVGSATAGFDHLDREWLESQKISWAHAPACNANSVVQYVITAIFQYLHKNKKSIAETTIGIIGVGNIGSRLEKILLKCGATVLLSDPPRAKKEEKFPNCDLNNLLQKSDIVTLHVPLSKTGDDTTFKMANDFFFEKLKKGALFINSSRGKVVDGSALEKALLSEKIEAILDVFPEEPNISEVVLKKSRFTTPHIAGYSADGKANATTQIITALEKAIPGITSPSFCAMPPLPRKNKNLTIDCFNKSVEEIAFLACTHSFELENESNELKITPEKFEYFRSSYPIRREQSFYNIALKNYKSEHKIILEQLNFNVNSFVENK